MISPTIGRVVLFWPAVPAGGLQRPQPHPALVSYVWNDRLINIGGFDGNGAPFSATSVPLVQDDDVTPAGYYAEWMPYQKAQAAKHDAATAVAPSTFQDRVRTERAELAIKADKLSDFLASPGADEIDVDERDRLTKQSVIMQDYLRVLDDRIAAFA